jgi:hypothetical protein
MLHLRMQLFSLEQLLDSRLRLPPRLSLSASFLGANKSVLLLHTPKLSSSSPVKFFTQNVFFHAASAILACLSKTN